MIKLNEVELLEQLVEIDSSNPGPYEAEIAGFLQNLARNYGFETEIIEPSPGRQNLIITMDAGGNSSLGFSGHLDTKPVGDASNEWRTPPWKFVRDGDIGYGLGTSDMKAGIAAMFVAAVEWSQLAKTGKLKLILTADEEQGSVYGAKYLSSSSSLGVNAILVGEPSGVDHQWESIYTVSRGISCFEITIFGQQGHSGLSANWTTSASIGVAKAILAIDQMKIRYPKTNNPLMRTTINSGVTINGGVMYGVHPGEARFKCDIRLVPGMTKEDLEEDIKRTLTSALPDDLRWEIRFEETAGWMPAVVIPDDHPLVLATQKASQIVLGKTVPLGIYPGGTDATHFDLIAGIPTLASFGPGWLSVAHGPNECVGITALTQAKEMYKLIATEYLVSEIVNGSQL
jgi:acetylornithine deacetylase/succinyl-diaminopimelate desuccinylase-like protein